MSAHVDLQLAGASTRLFVYLSTWGQTAGHKRSMRVRRGVEGAIRLPPIDPVGNHAPHFGPPPGDDRGEVAISGMWARSAHQVKNRWGRWAVSCRVA